MCVYMKCNRIVIGRGGQEIDILTKLLTDTVVTGGIERTILVQGN